MDPATTAHLARVMQPLALPAVPVPPAAVAAALVAVVMAATIATLAQARLIARTRRTTAWVILPLLPSKARRMPLCKCQDLSAKNSLKRESRKQRRMAASSDKKKSID